MTYLIITCGIIGTGKSTIAKEVAKRIDAEIISSDYVRKKLIAGISPKVHKYEKFGEGIYSKEFTERTYLKMVELAKAELAQDKSVILDASFSKRWQRSKAYELAMQMNSKFLCIEFTCSEEELKKRLGRRLTRSTGISNGRLEILSEHKASFEKVQEFTKELHLVVDTTYTKEECIEAILARLAKQKS
jgi:predicted kinase